MKKLLEKLEYYLAFKILWRILEKTSGKKISGYYISIENNKKIIDLFCKDEL